MAAGVLTFGRRHLLKVVHGSWQPRAKVDMFQLLSYQPGGRKVSVSGGTFATRPRFGIIIALVILSLFLGHFPVCDLILAPVNTFVTAVHEMGHAVACLATGGNVSGMTIVSDSEGHGGLTFCRGGIPFIYSQAGYLGAALFGCLLIALGRFPRLSKVVLVLIGSAICLASLFLMSGTIFHQGRILEGLGSMFWGLLIGAGFIWGGVKLRLASANLLLLFIAVQTALNALSGVGFLVQQSFGMFPGTWSDASNMAQMTGIPAFIWALFWASSSIVMVGATLWWTYMSERKGTGGLLS